MTPTDTPSPREPAGTADVAESLASGREQRLVARRFDEYWQGHAGAEIAARVRDGGPDPLLAEYARGATRIAEVGCGTGVAVFKLKRLFPDADVVGIDISPASVALCREAEAILRTGARFELADAHKLPGEDGTFDLVYSYGVMEHFTDPVPALREQARLLRPGGRLFVEVPYAFSSYAAWKAILVRLGKWKFGWETSYTAAGLRRKLEAAGVHVVRTARRETFLLARAANSFRYHARKRLGADTSLARAADLAERYAPIPRWRSLTLVAERR